MAGLPPRRYPARPPRLEVIHQQYQNPLWYLTLTTWNREPWLASGVVQQCVVDFATIGASSKRAFLGRYVLMPDHAHLFVQLGRDESLGGWVKAFKASLARAMNRTGRSWQPGFFDHLVRSAQSYREKWEYVLQNPVRTGLVTKPEDWLYQGEPMPLSFD